MNEFSILSAMCSAFAKFLISFFLFWIFLACTASPDPVILFESVGSSVDLRCEGAPGRDVEWRFKQQDYPGWQLMADLNFRGLSPGSGFQGRVKSLHLTKPGNYSLTLSHVEFTDQGIYECQYKNEPKTFLADVKLNILVPTVVSVPMGEDASLPCYVNVDRRARAEDLDVRWLRGREEVYRLRKSTGTSGPGFENRTILIPELALKGDLSLTIRQTQLSDEGKYRCTYGWLQKRGNPDYVDLTITASTGMPTAWVRILLVVIVSAVPAGILLVGVWAVKCRRKKKPAKCPDGYQTTTAEDQNKFNSRASIEARLLMTESSPSPIKAHPPVSESDPPPIKAHPLASESDPSPIEAHLPESESDPFPIEAHLPESESDPSPIEAHLPESESDPFPIEAHLPESESDPSPIEAHPLASESDPSPIEAHLPESESDPSPIEAHLPESESDPSPIEAHPLASESDPSPIEAHPLMSESDPSPTKPHRFRKRTFSN